MIHLTRDASQYGYLFRAIHDAAEYPICENTEVPSARLEEAGHFIQQADSGMRTEDGNILTEIVWGMDQERAITKALRDVYPEATLLYCVSHIMDNIIRKATNLGIHVKTRNNIIRRMQQILRIPDEGEFQQMVEELVSVFTRSVHNRSTVRFGEYLRYDIQLNADVK